MDIDSLFVTPDEDLDLSSLRVAINRCYRDAFKRIRRHLDDHDGTNAIMEAVTSTINEVDRLIEKHNDKHHPKHRKEPF